MDGRCQTCKWWVNDQRGDPKDPTYTDWWGECDLARTARYGRSIHPESRATADGDDASGILDTAFDFGCVQYERKDPT